jgi:hypothetical protein
MIKDPTDMHNPPWFYFINQLLIICRSFSQVVSNCAIDGEGIFRWESKSLRHQRKSDSLPSANVDLRVDVNIVTHLIITQIVRFCRLQ